jgi:PHS family inorganic phosphate transporter-like MFS transporter
LIPVKLFPTRVRGSYHGISAASGKAGAVLTAYAFATITDKIGLQGVLGLFSGPFALICLLTLWIPEAKGRTLEEIEHGALFGTGTTVEERTESSLETPPVLAQVLDDIRCTWQI